MAAIQQNTLYLTTTGSYVARDHLTLQVGVPIYQEGIPAAERTREKVTGSRKVSIPIHHLESICVFAPSTISAPALELCWEQGVAVNYLSEFGHLQARMTGVADTSVTLRRAQFRAADDPKKCAAVAQMIIAGKVQNSRNSLLRAARESEAPEDRSSLETAIEGLGRIIRDLERFVELGSVRGAEGMASAIYFNALMLTFKQQREIFAFSGRSRRPPRDRINCLLSFLYALVRHDCIAGPTAAGLDPFVGFLHVDRPDRPSLALDLMEEFRPWLVSAPTVTGMVRHFPAHSGTRSPQIRAWNSVRRDSSSGRRANSSDWMAASRRVTRSASSGANCS